MRTLFATVREHHLPDPGLDTAFFPPRWVLVGDAAEADQRRRALRPDVLKEAIDPPTVAQRVLQRAKALENAATAITKPAATTPVPDRRWYDLHIAACTAHARTFTGEARRAEEHSGGRWTSIAAAYAWCAHDLSQARSRNPKEAAALLRAAAERLTRAARGR